MMLLYMFAPDKFNYVRSMKRIHTEILAKLCNVHQSLHHTADLWNGEWSDMFIETTWMRQNYGPGSIIGDTDNTKTTATWLYIMDGINQAWWRWQASYPTSSCLIHRPFLLPRITWRRATSLNIVNDKGQTNNIDNLVDIGSTVITDFEASWRHGLIGFRHPSPNALSYLKRRRNA